MYKPLVIAALAALSLAGADITGKWTGGSKGSDGTVQFPVALDLKQDGEKISGVAGRDLSETAPIDNAKIDGNKLTFEVNGGSTIYKVNLTAEGDTMKGTVIRNRDGQDSQPVPIEVARQK